MLHIWIVFFSIGIVINIIGCIFMFIKFKREGVREKYFLLAALIEFAASYVLYIPVEIYNRVDQPKFGDFVYSLFSSMVKTISIISGNGYDAAVINGYSVFEITYGILRAVSGLLLMAFISGFFIKIFEGPIQSLFIKANKKGSTYFFSEFNEKTVETAKSLGAGNKIVFIGKKSSINRELMDELAEVKPLFLDDSFENTLKKLLRREKETTEVFLFSNETENLVALDKVINIVERNSRKNGKKRIGDEAKAEVKLFVELKETPWNLYMDYSKKSEAIANKRLLINFVRIEENFVYNCLWSNSIFENAVSESDGRHIKALIVGFNERNFEMLKAILWLGQMPGYKLSVSIIDSGNNRDRIKQMIPDIEIDSAYVKEGDAIYSFRYFGNVDYESSRVEEIVEKELSGFTFTFVNCGNDINNIKMAMRLNAVMHRIEVEPSCKVLANMSNAEISEKWQNDFIKDIQIVGSNYDVYNYKFISDFKLEECSREIHVLRQEKIKEKDENAEVKRWETYFSDEYSRHSVYARTLSLKYKVLLISKEFDCNYDLLSTKEWAVYEHMRWNMYTRMLGYRRSNTALTNLLNSGKNKKIIREIAKVHECLISFDELQEKTQNYDRIDLDNDIAKKLMDF